MSKKEIKKCIDCTWCQLDLEDPENSLCINPDFAEISLVTGKPEGPLRCSTRRLFPCGESAKFFSPANESSENFSEDPESRREESRKSIVEACVNWLKGEKDE